MEKGTPEFYKMMYRSKRQRQRDTVKRYARDMADLEREFAATAQPRPKKS